MRHAVVTGANKGIGLEICRQLISDGVFVILTARDTKRGLAAVENLRSCGLSDVIFHQLDVMNEASIACLAAFIKSQFGKIDILVNNAGVTGATTDWEAFRQNEATGNVNDLFKRITSQTYESAEECLKINYYGTKGVTEALLPYLLSSESAKIDNVSSSMGKLESIPCERIRKQFSDIDLLTRDKTDALLKQFLEDFKDKSLEAKGWPTYQSAYTLSKAAVNVYTRMLAKEYTSIRVNCVCPGFVKTDLNSNLGILTVEEGAKGPVKLTLLPQDGPSGLFFYGLEPSNF